MTNHHHEEPFRPRVILWQLHAQHDPGNDSGTNANVGSTFTTPECLLTIDSIVRVARPIVVLTGDGLLQRQDLHQILEYGTALGLKMIVETRADEITGEVLKKYGSFGSRIFRVVVDGAILEGSDSRFLDSPEYQALEQSIELLRENKFEVHLTTTIRRLEIRELAFQLDYALKKNIRGLYCHLCFDEKTIDAGSGGRESENLSEFIGVIARMKNFLPKEMYFSPQCIRYGFQPPPLESDRDHDRRAQWGHCCLAGRSFIVINHRGELQPCSNIALTAGSLRENGYDFRKMWERAPLMQELRKEIRSCLQTNVAFGDGSRIRADVNGSETTRDEFLVADVQGDEVGRENQQLSA